MTALTWLPLPVLLPFLIGVLLLSVRHSPKFSRAGLVVGTGATLIASLGLLNALIGADPVQLSFGGWEAPVGIAFWGDGLSAIMVAVSGIIALAGALYACGEIGRVLWRKGYAFFYLLLLSGINGAFLTGDLFNLFVWFEVMLMASFAMMVLGRRRLTFPGATQYVAINMVASFFFLSGLGIIYGKTGSLNLFDVAAKLSETSSDPLILTSATLLLVAFGVKAGVFPLYFWLPASYPHTGFATAAVFGGLLTKVGVYALFRVFGGAFAFLSDFSVPLFLGIGALTMVFGVLGAAAKFGTREILSFHIISQIGYLIVGLGLFTQGAIAAAIFYTVHHILVKTNLFFAAGLICRAGGSERLEKVGGLLKSKPLLAWLFAIPAMSLAGIPPLSGFFAKFLLIRESIREGVLWVAAVALVVGIVTLFSMAKIWAEAFWKAHPITPRSRSLPVIQIIPVACLAALTISIGLFADGLFSMSDFAAEQLLEQRTLNTSELASKP